MRGVDLLDQAISYHMVRHRSKKWWRRVFFYGMMVSAHNAYVVAKDQGDACHRRQWPTFLDFLESLTSKGSGSCVPSTSVANLPRLPGEPDEQRIRVMRAIDGSGQPSSTSWRAWRAKDQGDACHRRQWPTFLDFLESLTSKGSGSCVPSTAVANLPRLSGEPDEQRIRVMRATDGSGQPSSTSWRAWRAKDQGHACHRRQWPTFLDFLESLTSKGSGSCVPSTAVANLPRLPGEPDEQRIRMMRAIDGSGQPSSTSWRAWRAKDQGHACHQRQWPTFLDFLESLTSKGSGSCVPSTAVANLPRLPGEPDEQRIRVMRAIDGSGQPSSTSWRAWRAKDQGHACHQRQWPTFLDFLESLACDLIGDTRADGAPQMSRQPECPLQMHTLERMFAKRWLLHASWGANPSH